MLPYILLIIGFILLIKGADLLVDGASSLARKLKISDLAIGLTVVAFGTSSPELFVNMIASLNGATDIAVGNILGSNIANIFLILGIASIIFPLVVTKGTVWKEIPLSFFAALLMGILANDRLLDGKDFSALTRIDGMILLSFFIIFIYYTATIAKDIQGMNEHVLLKNYSRIKTLFFIVIGLTILILGSKLVVDGAVQIALRFGVSQSLIGLTIVAVGTSLPELAASAMAAFKKNPEIAVGNVVGSNIFNIFFILGISSVIRPLPFHPGTNTDIGVAVFASFLLFICMFTGEKHKIDRWEGFVFVGIYVTYITFIIMRS